MSPLESLEWSTPFEPPADGDGADRQEAPIVLALVGPTATGKTALSLALAERLPVEIVSADSRMVYRWMDIGTAKPSWEERTRVPHHLVDVVDPDEPYSVALYQQQALAAIGRIHARGRLPLLVGGTGLYVRAVCDGLRIPAVTPDETYRRELEERAAREGWPALQAELAQVDPASAARIDPRNVRRVIRALEVQRATGVPFSAWQERRPPPFRTVFAGLDVPRPLLYERIDRRVLEQIDAGLIEEVRALVARGYDSNLVSMSGFGYREIGQFLRGECDRATAIARYQQATRHYARRQLTWFRPDARIHWFDATSVTPDAVIEVCRSSQGAGR
ncbi:MAG: tRNA (adenosine(37)-N6)-dimethylallyltransferase MiaA [Chloroflexota bacterium]